MTMRPHCVTLCAALFAGAAVGQERPNIVLILADDLGYGDPSCYNDESKIPTPHIDRLAREGRRFTDAHSPSSVCTPTRYALLTGRYAWRTPLERSVLWPWDPPLLEDERVTLPEFLRAKGYRTACIGKWHLGWNWRLLPAPRAPEGTAASYVRDELRGHTWPRRRRAGIAARVDWSAPIKGGPLAHGFDSYFGDDVPNFPPYAFILDDRVTVRPSVSKPKGMFGHAGPAAPGWDLSQVMPLLAQRAATWIDEHAASGARASKGARDSTPSGATTNAKPFFLYLPLTAPHTPIAPTPVHVGKSKAGAYGDFVHEVDWFVGVVLRALDRNRLGKNTLVIFTSDNGSPQRDGTRMSGPVGAVKKRFGHDPSKPWRGLKSDAWEGGHRVPCILRWPGRIKPGSLCDAPISLSDFYRSIAGIVGHEVSAEQGEDSFDVRKHLIHGAGKDAAVRDHLVHHSGNGLFAIRVGRYKLILGRGSGGFSRYRPPKGAPAGQLYDLVADPGERKNLYAEKPEVVERLRAKLHGLRKAGRSVPRE